MFLSYYLSFVAAGPVQDSCGASSLAIQAVQSNFIRCNSKPFVYFDPLSKECKTFKGIDGCHSDCPAHNIPTFDDVADCQRSCLKVVPTHFYKAKDTATCADNPCPKKTQVCVDMSSRVSCFVAPCHQFRCYE